MKLSDNKHSFGEILVGIIGILRLIIIPLAVLFALGKLIRYIIFVL